MLSVLFRHTEIEKKCEVSGRRLIAEFLQRQTENIESSIELKVFFGNLSNGIGNVRRYALRCNVVLSRLVKSEYVRHGEHSGTVDCIR